MIAKTDLLLALAKEMRACKRDTWNGNERDYVGGILMGLKYAYRIVKDMPHGDPKKCTNVKYAKEKANAQNHVR